MIGRLLERVSVSTLTGIFLFGLTANGLILLTYALHTRRKVRNLPYYKEAFRLLDRNKVAVELLGEPVIVGDIDLNNKKRNLIDTTLTRLSIPVEGKHRKGHLDLTANRADESSEWSINTLELRLNGNLANKRIIVYRSKLDK